MREIVFDTETTGLNCQIERIVEIGCVEILHKKPTGRTFHYYINPEKNIDPGAVRIHGITDEKVRDKPKFKEIVEEFLAFIEDSPLVAHNAEFDMGFLNAELKRLDRVPLETDRFVDSLKIARKKFPKAKNTLDALCQRYKIDLSERSFHGALLDSYLLVEVYRELTGGSELTFGFEEPLVQETQIKKKINPLPKRKKKLPDRLTEVEKKRHKRFIIEEMRHALWENYIDLTKKEP